MFRLGSRLLKTRRFDLIYFSTTQFPLFCLGPIWRLLYRVPYVLDFQDPWYLLKYKYIASTMRWKWKLSRLLARPLQRLAVSRADAIVAVSPRYLEELRFVYQGQRYRWLAAERQAVVPFAGSTVDIQTMRGILNDRRSRRRLRLRVRCRAAPSWSWCMSAPAALRGSRRGKRCARRLLPWRSRNPGLIERFQFRLHGTTSNPAAPDAGLLEQTANSAGLAGIVAEYPAQVSYFRSLELAHRSAGLVVLGVDDDKYTPSKLFSYLLFDQPVLGRLPCPLAGRRVSSLAPEPGPIDLLRSRAAGSSPEHAADRCWKHICKTWQRGGGTHGPGNWPSTWPQPWLASTPRCSTAA